MIFNVLLPLPFGRGFDYRVPAHMQVAPGDYVRVPFGRKSVWGVVWGAAEGGFDAEKIKAIEAVAAHLPPMSKTMRDFIDWVAWYTLSPAGMVLKMVLSSPEALEPPAVEARYVLAQGSGLRAQSSEETLTPDSRSPIPKLTPARLRITAYLSDGTARSAKEITVHAKVTTNVVREFIKAGGLEVISGQWPVISEKKESDHRTLTTDHILSPAQSSAAAILQSKLGSGFSVTVLDGVTGSGKTEVYFDAIAHCLEAGNQALVLLPEIALSVQWLSRFEKRFGFAPDIWHSHVTSAKKRGSWRSAASGELRVVVGARSALFLPFAKLGVIVVDEEHDTSYKQEEGVIYHARDMAVVRAAREKLPVVLVSATPSLETEYNIEQGRYVRVHLPARHGGAELPTITLVDMRKEKLGSAHWISEPLREALLATLARGEQAMLFMNRRGYAPLLLCRGCGHRFQCPHCTSWLVMHRKRNQLVCHHCGHVVGIPKECPSCKKEDTLIPFGPGVERVAEEVRALFPQARVAVITSDTSIISNSRNGSVDTPQERSDDPAGEVSRSETGGSVPPEHLLNAMIKGDIDILIGTQMIAKGHHFAGLALVGVIDGDMSLAGGDLRAGEHTYQLLHQLAGRAGREKTKGEVLLQTYLPEHPVMQALAAGERDRFMLLESQMREDAAMPPYGKLAAVIVEGKNEQEVMKFARELVRDQGAELRIQHKKDSSEPRPPTPDPLILGPAPAPLLLLRGKYRYRILVKAARSFPLQQWLSDWLFARKIPSTLRVKIDVDPYSFI